MVGERRGIDGTLSCVLVGEAFVQPPPGVRDHVALEVARDVDIRGLRRAPDVVGDPGKRALLEQIVGIEEHQPFARHLLQARIAGRSVAAVALGMDHLDRFMRAGDRVDDRRRHIRRRIIDDDHLDRDVAIGQSARDGCEQRGLAVVRGDEDGEQGPGHRRSSLPYRRTLLALRTTRVASSFASTRGSEWALRISDE